MSVRCKYCDSQIPDNAEFCPNCGAKRPQESEPDTPQAARNSASARYAKPRTIEELRTFCAEKGMSLEKMRFFIGEDYKEPRGIGTLLMRRGSGLSTIPKRRFSSRTSGVKTKVKPSAAAMPTTYGITLPI